MKKFSIILASLVFIGEISVASPFQNNQTQEKTKTVKKADKKPVKKVPARKNVTKKSTAPAKSVNTNSTISPATTK